MHGREARANGDERDARTGGESGREPPRTRGPAPVRARAEAPRRTREHRDRRAGPTTDAPLPPPTPPPPRQTPFSPSSFPCPPPPPLLPRRGIGKSRDAPAVPGAGRAGGRALREAEREATGDGRPAGTTEPPSEREEGRGTDGRGTAGAEPGRPPVGTQRHTRTETPRGRHAPNTRPTPRTIPGAAAPADAAGAHGRAGAAAGPPPKHTGKRGATPGRRGNHPRPPRAGSEDREPAGGRPRQRGRRETGRRPTPGEKRRMRTGPTPDTRRRRPRADRWRRRGGGRRATLTPRGGREGGRARVGREAGPRGSEGERHRPEPPPPHRDAHTGSTQRPGAHLGTPAAFPRRTPSQRTAGPDGPPRRRTLSQQAPRTGVGDSH